MFIIALLTFYCVHHCAADVLLYLALFPLDYKINCRGVSKRSLSVFFTAMFVRGVPMCQTVVGGEDGKAR